MPEIRQEMPLIQITTTSITKPKFLNNQMKGLLTVIVALAVSFYIEAFFNIIAGRILRALATSFVAFQFWKILSLPKEKSWLAKWLWASAWCTVLGLWGYGLVPAYGIHLLHITFIGGFSLMTLMITTRVTIAHGDEEYHLEESSKALKWAGILILVAMVTRILAPFTKSAYRTHLGYASLTWIIALLLWGVVFSRRIVHTNSPQARASPEYAP